MLHDADPGLHMDLLLQDLQVLVVVALRPVLHFDLSCTPQLSTRCIPMHVSPSSGGHSEVNCGQHTSPAAMRPRAMFSPCSLNTVPNCQHHSHQQGSSSGSESIPRGRSTRCRCGMKPSCPHSECEGTRELPMRRVRPEERELAEAASMRQGGHRSLLIAGGEARGEDAAEGDAELGSGHLNRKRRSGVGERQASSSR